MVPDDLDPRPTGAGPPADADPGGQIGRVIGPYRILRPLGRGGQATVFLAEHTKLHNRVALKVIDPPVVDARVIERFRLTAEITARLDHPGICTVFDTGKDQGSHWIAMRYVDGESLSDKLVRARTSAASGSTSTWALVADGERTAAAPPLPGAESEPAGPKTWPEIAHVLALFEEAARALHVAHEAGIIHRDIKPGNVMVTKDGTPVIVDFGLAQDVESEPSMLTLTGDLMGTPAYMSPEQLAGPRIRLDKRTDVYSLGVSLFECLTTRRPFAAPTRESLYQAIMTKEPPDLRKLNAAVSSDLRVVVSTAIEKDRDRRYATSLDFAEDLRRVRLHEPIMAKPVSRLVKLERWAQRNPALATAVGGLFATLAIGLAVALFLLGQRDRALAEVTTERNEKQAALSDYDRLGDLSRLERLEAEADALWPCAPAQVPPMEAWLAQADALAQRLDGHAATLEALRRTALPATSESRPGQDRPASRFATDAEQFKHDTTAALVTKLRAFADPDPPKGLLAGVRARHAFASSVERATIRDHAASWAAAIKSIADPSACPKYAGLAIKPQLGLIPLWRNEQGLWEFAHLQTAAPGQNPVPRRGDDGRLVVTEDMGIVFVLLPAGTFRMGATKPASDATDPADPNVDPDTLAEESPVTEVTLAAFFLSKYEMTQGQWRRFVGRNPSQYGPTRDARGRPVDLRHPVEQVSHDECARWIGRLGLTLPTEAQWEYAARAGTATPRSTGLDPAALAKAANLADAYFKAHGGPSNIQYEPWDDGFPVHAPAGSFAPNPFGLHDVLGNVWEWCRDWYGGYDVPPRAGDGLRTPSSTHSRVVRGGAFNYSAANARSANRLNIEPHFRYGNVGLRPARAVVD